MLVITLRKPSVDIFSGSACLVHFDFTPVWGVLVMFIFPRLLKNLFPSLYIYLSTLWRLFYITTASIINCVNVFSTHRPNRAGLYVMVCIIFCIRAEECGLSRHLDLLCAYCELWMNCLTWMRIIGLEVSQDPQMEMLAPSKSWATMRLLCTCLHSKDLNMCCIHKK